MYETNTHQSKVRKMSSHPKHTKSSKGSNQSNKINTKIVKQQEKNNNMNSKNKVKKGQSQQQFNVMIIALTIVLVLKNTVVEPFAIPNHCNSKILTRKSFYQHFPIQYHGKTNLKSNIVDTMIQSPSS